MIWWNHPRSLGFYCCLALFWLSAPSWEEDYFFCGLSIIHYLKYSSACISNIDIISMIKKVYLKSFWRLKFFAYLPETDKNQASLVYDHNHLDSAVKVLQIFFSHAHPIPVF